MTEQRRDEICHDFLGGGTRYLFITGDLMAHHLITRNGYAVNIMERSLCSHVYMDSDAIISSLSFTTRHGLRSLARALHIVTPKTAASSLKSPIPTPDPKSLNRPRDFLKGTSFEPSPRRLSALSLRLTPYPQRDVRR